MLRLFVLRDRKHREVKMAVINYSTWNFQSGLLNCVMLYWIASKWLAKLCDGTRINIFNYNSVSLKNYYMSRVFLFCTININRIKR